VGFLNTCVPARAGVLAPRARGRDDGALFRGRGLGGMLEKDRVALMLGARNWELR